MSDPFRRYKSGDAAPRDAGSFDAFALAARDARDRLHDRGADARTQTRQGDIVKVKNETGADLHRNSVVGLGAPIFTPAQSVDAFLREVTFRGVLPTGAHEAKFAVLLEPALNGRVARAYVAGVVPVKVDIVQADQTCAKATSGETGFLTSADDGSAQILWREGDSDAGKATGEQWAVVRFGSVCGGSKKTTGGKCDCPEAGYTVEVDCGDCGPYGAYGQGGYGGGTTMPKYWWVTIGSSASTVYAYYDACTAIPCEELAGRRIRMSNEEGVYGEPTCTWSGRGSSCVHAELTTDGGDWKLTILDKDDCVLAVFHKPYDQFDCCGANSGWTADVNNSCAMTVTVDPDPCTCCPDRTCPPDGRSVCGGTACCLEDCNCSISVTANNLYTIPGLACTPGALDCTCDDGTPCSFGGACADGSSCVSNRPTPQASCGGMDGVYAMAWESDCTWKFRGVPAGGSTKVSATLTLSGKVWQMQIFGADGQTATLHTVDWNCEQAVSLVYASGSCPNVAPGPGANFNLCLNVN